MNCTPSFIGTIDHFYPKIFGQLNQDRGTGQWYRKGNYPPPPPIFSSLRVICQAKCITLITFAYFTVVHSNQSHTAKDLTKKSLHFIMSATYHVKHPDDVKDNFKSQILTLSIVSIVSIYNRYITFLCI